MLASTAQPPIACTNVVSSESCARESTTSVARRRLPLTPALDELEPVTNGGDTFDFWREEMTTRRALGDRAVGAGFATLIPEEAVLGKGMYGVVWRAQSTKHGALYAVKNVRSQPGQNTTLAARECQVADLVRLQPHPCIVHLFLTHHFADVGLFMQVMEFCSGGNILAQVYNSRRLAEAARRQYDAPEKSVLWVGQVFLGLEHLHIQMQTLLRDLKPANVVLDTLGRAKLTDFGFGRFGAESNGMWTFGCPPGSPGYICPEILNQQEYDFKADLYSFGVLVWVLLSGGVSYDPQPRPPWGCRKDANGREVHDFKAHLRDWKFLKECLDDPENHGALRLGANAKTFVASLTHRRAHSRSDHKGIRQTTFMQDLRLPLVGASQEQIEKWCDAWEPCRLPSVQGDRERCR